MLRGFALPCGMGQWMQRPPALPPVRTAAGNPGSRHLTHAVHLCQGRTPTSIAATALASAAAVSSSSATASHSPAAAALL